MGCDKFLILTIPLANINERCKKEFECYKCGGDIIIDEEESIIEHFHCADLMELIPMFFRIFIKDILAVQRLIRKFNILSKI